MEAQRREENVDEMKKKETKTLDQLPEYCPPSPPLPILDDESLMMSNSNASSASIGPSASSASIGPSASQVCNPLHHQQVALKKVDRAMLAAMRGYAKSIMANEYRDVSNFDNMEAQRREEFFKRIKECISIPPHHREGLEKYPKREEIYKM